LPGGKVFALVLALSVVAPLVRAGPVSVAMLGDSLTQGYGLQAGDGLTDQLEVWLQREGNAVRIVNAGVSGDTTAGGLARIDWTLGDEIDALIVALGANDMLRGLDPANARTNLDGILVAAQRRDVPVLLVGLTAPANYGADYQRDFAAVYADLAQRHDALLYADLFAVLRAQDDPARVLAELMQSDGIHPNAAGAKMLAAALGPEVERLMARIGGVQ